MRDPSHPSWGSHLHLKNTEKQINKASKTGLLRTEGRATHVLGQRHRRCQAPGTQQLLFQGPSLTLRQSRADLRELLRATLCPELAGEREGHAPDKPHSPNRLLSTPNRLEKHSGALCWSLCRGSSHTEAPGGFLQCHDPPLNPSWEVIGPLGLWGAVNTSAPSPTPFTASLESNPTPWRPQNLRLGLPQPTGDGDLGMDPSQVRVTQDTSPAGQKGREQSKGLCTPSCSAQHPTTDQVLGVICAPMS